MRAVWEPRQMSAVWARPALTMCWRLLDAPKSQLYHYFADKADLVRAVVDRQLELILDGRPAIARVDSWAGLRR